MHSKRHSIFIKLISIIIGTGILISVGLAVFFRIHFNTRVREQFNANLEQYFSYIAKDIGTPPDTLKAKSIADKYAIAIKYEGENIHWQYGEFDFNKRKALKPFVKIAKGLLKEDAFIIINKDGSRYLFAADFNRFINPNHANFIFLLSYFLIILSLSYLAIRRILKPIKYLNTGVNELSKGNLDHNIPVKSRDELAVLSDSFNRMTKKIKEMLKARDQLLLDVSHELRSPLTRIKLALEFIKDDKSKESISSDVKEIEMMVTELLESERLKDDHGKLKLNKSNLSNLLDEIIKPYKGSKPSIITQDIPESLMLNVDEERIKLVFKNLLDNAVKYSHAQSRPVTITAEEFPDKAVIRIRDDGIGIPAEDLPLIFEPFFRVDKSRTRKTGGYGLGLSMCKKIIEAHGGKISIMNNPDRGITVEIELKK